MNAAGLSPNPAGRHSNVGPQCSGMFPPRLLSPSAGGGLFIRAHDVLPGTHSCIDRKVYQSLRILAGVALANPELLNVDGGE